MWAVPGFSFVVTLLAGVGAWGMRSRSNPVVGGSFLTGFVMIGTGVMLDLGWLLRSGVFASAVFLGVAIGRAIAPNRSSMLILLGVLSVADIIWIVSGGGSATGWEADVVNFSVQLGTSSSSIGTADLVLAAMVTTHWLQRDAGVWLALAAAPVGMVVANVYVALTSVDNLPLVPFITLGWLATEAWHRRTAHA